MMTDSIAAVAPKTPWHLWLVCAVSLLWNSFGAFDYTMTEMQNAAYLADFTVAQRAYFANFPWYAVMLWALGVWGALAGSVLLLARSRHAVTAFVISLLGLAGSTAWQFWPSNTDLWAIMPEGAWLLNVVIWTVAIALLLYARWARRRGWLR